MTARDRILRKWVSAVTLWPCTGHFRREADKCGSRSRWSDDGHRSRPWPPGPGVEDMMATDPAASPPASSQPPSDPLQDSGSAEATLKPGAIGFVSSMVIGLASTSPAYSLAAILGPMVALLGVYAPGALLASFVPMLLIASAFYFLNKVDSDCGTTFSWVTRAMGPWFGWIGGWAIGMTGVLVVGSLADVGVTYFLLAIGADDLADNEWAVKALTIGLIIVMTAICVVGTELSARLQDVLIIAQVLALLAFAIVAITSALNGTSTLDATTPELSWLNPF